MIRVVVADDQSLIRIGLRVLLDAEEDMALVAEAGDGSAALRLVRQHRPEVVLMDIRMPVLDGIEALRALAADEDLAHTRIIMLTTFELDEYVFESLQAGASGFLIKDSDPTELLHAIRVVAAGESLLSPTITRKVISRFAERPPARQPHPELDRLTGRERETLALVGAGLSNEEIAERLVVSPATARTHVSRAMVKLHARDRAQLAVFAYQSGLTAPS